MTLPVRSGVVRVDSLHLSLPGSGVTDTPTFGHLCVKDFILRKVFRGSKVFLPRGQWEPVPVWEKQERERTRDPSVLYT